MPIIKSAIKRAKQTIKRNERNVGIKRDIKDAMKAFTTTPTATTLSKAQSEIDTAVKKKLLSKNTASRRKANLSKAAKAAGVTFDSVKATAKKAAPKAVAKPATKTAAKPAAKKAPATKAAAKPAAKK